MQFHPLPPPTVPDLEAGPSTHPRLLKKFAAESGANGRRRLDATAHAVPASPIVKELHRRWTSPVACEYSPKDSLHAGVSVSGWTVIHSNDSLATALVRRFHSIVSPWTRTARSLSSEARSSRRTRRLHCHADAVSRSNRRSDTTARSHLVRYHGVSCAAQTSGTDRS